MNFSAYQVGPVLVYTGWFTLAWLVSTFALLVVVALILAPTKAFNKRPDGTVANWPVIPVMMPFIFSGLVAYYGLGAVFGRYPPPLAIEDARVTADKMGELETKAKGIQSRFSNPKALTIEQLESALAEVLVITREFSLLNEAQRKQISALQASVIEEQKKADEARKLAQEIQSLTSGQIAAVQLLITKDANESAERSFFIGILVSFPIGILASLIASWLYRRLGKEKIVKVARDVTFEFSGRELKTPREVQSSVAVGVPLSEDTPSELRP